MTAPPNSAGRYSAVNIGYACIALGVPGAQLRTCRLSSASPEMLYRLVEHNLSALEAMLRYNAREGICLYRISSEIIPFGSHPDIRFPWRELFAPRLDALGVLIRQWGMRVSMHPGQYTLLNAKDAGVIRRSFDDLRYHAAMLDALGTDHTHKIVLHIGGVYGDKAQSIQRFKDHFKELEPAVRRRIVIENDDRHFHIGEVLDTASALGIPAVFDILHHAVNNCGGSDTYWIEACRPTWDSRQKIHFSTQAAGKKQGAHSDTVRVREFMDFFKNLPGRDIDIMLEVKDKNLSALKCMLASTDNKEITRLEREWSRYKYAVLERDPAGYQRIRQLLKDKSAYPAEDFYDIVEQALEKPFHAGHALNAAQHVWGYFNSLAADSEKRRFISLTESYNPQNAARAKDLLKNLAGKYNVTYLLESLYFLEL